MNRQYYSMEKFGEEVNINIYGDITSYAGEKGWSGEEISGASMKTLSRALEGLTDISQINVFINSYGGEVAEGLAIYNALKRHKAKVTTYCEGFAASIASVIFMAGDKRVMSECSLLMIHNAWTFADGNAEQLRKIADDLDKITQASVNAYKAVSTLTEDEIKALMNNEEWILPEEAIEYGFATHIENKAKKTASQRMRLFELFKQKAKGEDDPKDDDTDDEKPTDDPKDDDAEDNSKDKDIPEDEEETDEEKPEEADDMDDETDDEEEKPNQYLNSIFNAILKM